MKHDFVGVYHNTTDNTFVHLPVSVSVPETLKDAGVQQQLVVAGRHARVKLEQVTRQNSSLLLIDISEQPCKNDLASILLGDLISGKLRTEERAAAQAGDRDRLGFIRTDIVAATKHGLSCQLCRSKVLYLNGPRYREIVSSAEKPPAAPPTFTVFLPLTAADPQPTAPPA